MLGRSARFFQSLRHVSVCVPDAEAVEEDVNEGNDEDHDQDDVVEDVRRPLVVFVVNVEAADD